MASDAGPGVEQGDRRDHREADRQQRPPRAVDRHAALDHGERREPGPELDAGRPGVDAERDRGDDHDRPHEARRGPPAQAFEPSRDGGHALSVRQPAPAWATVGRMRRPLRSRWPWVVVLALVGAVLARRRSARAPASPLPPLAGTARVGAVIPVLDEAGTIGGVIAEVRAAGIDRIVVVDGGSSDGSPDVARAAGRSRRRGAAPGLRPRVPGRRGCRRHRRHRLPRRRRERRSGVPPGAGRPRRRRTRGARARRAPQPAAEARCCRTSGSATAS